MARTYRRTAHLFTPHMDGRIITHIREAGFINLKESFEVLSSQTLFSQAGLDYNAIMSRYYHKLRVEHSMFKLKSISGEVYYNRKQIRRVF